MEDINELHKRLYELLKIFSNVCEENNLEYWLDGGTALGAARHKGFIPWDDDVDVAMPYKDFKKLLKLSKDKFPLNVELQSPKQCNQHFAKLRDCNSTFLENNEHLSINYNQGVYIDIFPMVPYPNFSKEKRIKEINRITHTWAVIQNGIRKQSVSKIHYLYFIIKKIIWNINTTKKTEVFANLPEDNGYNIVHHYKDLYPLKKVIFEDSYFPVPNNLDNYLNDLYKDYTILPPIEKRKTHYKYIELSKPSLYVLKKHEKEYAPVAIFVFNRLGNTKKTIKALRKNYLAKETDVFVFSDAAKENDKKNKRKVKRIRNYLKSINGFKSVTIIERERNFYIEQNIINGINQVFEKHDKIIVLEDDVITSKYFLQFMNNSLNIYKNDSRIAQISGWQIVPNLSKTAKTIFWKYLEISGGWATWKDRWNSFKYYETENDALSDLTDEEIETIQFHNTFPCLNTLKLNPIPWDICWFISIIKNKQLTVNPSISYTKNIGLYNGSHFSSNKLLYKSKFDTKIYKKGNMIYNTDILEDEYSTAMLEEFFYKENNSKTFIYSIISIFIITKKIMKKIISKL